LCWSSTTRWLADVAGSKQRPIRGKTGSTGKAPDRQSFFCFFFVHKKEDFLFTC